MDAYDRGLDPAWRETILRFTRQRMLEHRHPQAVARALREVPRSAPFEAISELEFCDLPALVVASHDAADPGHPYAVAAAYAESLPEARLISEAEGESPAGLAGRQAVAGDRLVLRRAGRRGEARIEGVALLPRRAIAQPVDEPQPGPGVVDRAHLVVDHAVGDRDLAHDVLGQVRGRRRRSPSATRSRARRPAPGRRPAEGSAARAADRRMKKATITSSGAADPGANRDSVGQRAQRMLEIVRSAGKRDPVALRRSPACGAAGCRSSPPFMSTRRQEHRAAGYATRQPVPRMLRRP